MKKMTRLLSLALVLVLCLSVLPVGAAAAGYTGWQKIEGSWYYIENGGAATGWRKIGGSWYYLVPEWGGIMLTGWLNTDPNYFTSDNAISGDWYHFNSSGVMEAGKWVSESYTYEGTTYKDWYYLLSNGKGATGWQKIGGVWYYFDPDYGEMLVGGPYHLADGNWYYFKDSGALYTGWKSFVDNGTTYWAYFTSNGAVMDGWKKINGSWYYFEDGYIYTDGVYDINGSYYYFNSSGAMKTGWQKVEIEGDWLWLYFTSSGAAKKDGWVKSGNYWYYFEDYGYYYGGSATIGSYEYYFDGSGHMITGWVHFKNDAGNYVGWAYYLSSGHRVQSGSVKLSGKTYYFSNGWCTNP